MHDLKRQAEALRAAAHAIDLAQSGTGRTTRMMEQVCDGDTVICTPREAGHIRHLAYHQNTRVEVKTTPAAEFLSQRENTFRGRGGGYIHFSHDFIQELIELEIFETIMRLGRKLNEVNANEDARRAMEFRENMMAPNPILGDLNFMPVSKKAAQTKRNSSRASRPLVDLG